MSDTKAFYQIALSLISLLAMVWLQATAAVEPGNADTAEADAQKAAAAQRNLLAASNRSDTRHELIIGAEKLAYTASAASLDVGNVKAEPTDRVFYISYTADRFSDNEPMALKPQFSGSTQFIQFAETNPKPALGTPMMHLLWWHINGLSH